MLAKHIKKLLENHSRVIVPDLGAFMLKGDEAKTIYFNEFLRFNDGVLVEHIAETENIDKIEAAKLTKKYVDKINKTLVEKRSSEVEDIGILYFDDNEKIQFKPLGDAGSSPLTETKPIITVTAANPKVATVTENTGEQKKTPPKEPSPATHKKAKVPPQAPAPEIKTVVTPKVPTETPIVLQEKSSFRPVYKWLITIVIIALLAASYFFIFRKSSAPAGTEVSLNNDTINNDTIAAPATSAKKADSIYLEKTVVPMVSTEKARVPVPKSSKLYYAVAGCFAIESNADRLVSTLQKEGYSAEKFGKLGPLYCVSFQSFTNRADCLRELKKFRENRTPEAWIIYY